MDANEQAPVETTTQTEVAEPEVAGSEAAQTPTNEAGSSDFKRAMYEERDKRKSLESRLTDPNFIYEQASRLGLVETEESPTESVSPAAQPRIQQPPVDVSNLVRHELEMQKVVEKYPELQSDDQLGTMVTGLMQSGMSPLKAADAVMSRMSKAKQEQETTATQERDQQIATKQRSQTLAGENQTEASGDEISRLRRLVRSGDKAESNKAMLEILKLRNKQSGLQ